MAGTATVSRVKDEEAARFVGMLKDLVQFIDSAERIGNYPPNTAAGLKAAVRLAAKVLTEEEAASLDTFRDHLEQIFQRVFNKNKGRMSATSIGTYQRRVASLISDYDQYGRNASTMAMWKRKVRTVSPRRSHNGGAQLPSIEEPTVADMTGMGGGPSMNRQEISLRPNVKAILLVPADLTEAEAKRIKTFVDANVVS